jgi:hypothetical protein
MLFSIPVNSRFGARFESAVPNSRPGRRLTKPPETFTGKPDGISTQAGERPWARFAARR